MIQDLGDLTMYVSRFVLGQNDIEVNGKSEKEKCSHISQLILSVISSFPKVEMRLALANSISQALDGDSERSKKRIREIKGNISEGKGWFKVLLGSPFKPEVKVRSNIVLYNNNAAMPIQKEGRYAIESRGNFCALVASSFVTTKPERILAENRGPILDGGVGGYVTDNNGHITGYCLALGDGAGGHIDAHQDYWIARTSYFAAKRAAHLLSMLSIGGDFSTQVHDFLPELSRSIQLKGGTEATNLLAARADFMEGSFSIRGFAIGDVMLIGWHAGNHTFYPLLPSIQTERGTALLPSFYKKFEVRTFVETLPESTLLFAMTDGAHEELSLEVSEGTYENKLAFRSQIPTETFIETLFEPLSGKPLAAYVEAILSHAFEAIESKRKVQYNEQRLLLGDDLSIIACELKRPTREGLFGRMKRKLTS